MTRQHNEQFHCPNCKTWSTNETSFGRWIRNNEDLDSGKGFCVIDQDYHIHKFFTNGNRCFQRYMQVEIKTNGAKLSFAQRDTLFLVSKMLGINKTHKLINSIGKEIEVISYGVHLLTFSGLGPDDSKTIHWDKTIINEKILTELMSFKINPYDFKKQ